MSLKRAWLRSRDPFNFLLRPKISPERLKLDTANFVHWFAMQCFSIGITDCPLSGRGHGHVIFFSNFGK